MCNGYTHTVVVTIGRKVGAHTMSDARWQGYKRSVLAALMTSGCVLLQYPQDGQMRAHDQVGEWEGQSEPAAAYVAFIEGYRDIADLRTRLKQVAIDYEQQAIGCIVTFGTDHLVTT